MGEAFHLHFSNGDEEIAALFWNIGLGRNTARVLTLLIKDEDLNSREIERAADLRQPEVSVAISDLTDRKWVHIVRQVAENKGRPMKVYHLAKGLEEILDELQRSIRDAYEEKFNEIEKVRELLHV